MEDSIKFQKILKKYLIGIFVAKEDGFILFSKTFNDDFQLSLMGDFIAALSMFGDENVGKIKRILIEGLDVELNIVVKHGLILTIMFKPNIVKDHITDFYITGLDRFYAEFKEEIEQNQTELISQRFYKDVEPKMYKLLYEYLIHIKAI